MKDKIVTTFSENLSWLATDAKTHTVLSSAVASQVAEYISAKYPGVSPVEALSVFEQFSGNQYDPVVFAEVCKALCEQQASRTHSPETAVYFRTPVSDRAYDEFSKVYRNLGAAYAPDFKSVCEDVYYDRADACILPLESSEDGLLTGFRQMVLRHELKILSAVRVPTGEDAYQVMALLTNGNTDGDGEYSEFCIPSLDGNEFSHLCRVISALGIRIVRATSVPSKNRTSYDCHISLYSDAADFRPLKFFLDAKYPANILLGQYKYLDTERNNAKK